MNALAGAVIRHNYCHLLIIVVLLVKFVLFVTVEMLMCVCVCVLSPVERQFVFCVCLTTLTACLQLEASFTGFVWASVCVCVIHRFVDRAAFRTENETHAASSFQMSIPQCITGRAQFTSHAVCLHGWSHASEITRGLSPRRVSPKLNKELISGSHYSPAWRHIWPRTQAFSGVIYFALTSCYVLLYLQAWC